VHVYASVQFEQGNEQLEQIPPREYIPAGHSLRHAPLFCTNEPEQVKQE